MAVRGDLFCRNGHDSPDAASAEPLAAHRLVEWPSAPLAPAARSSHVERPKARAASLRKQNNRATIVA